MRGTIERIAVFLFLAACLLGPFPSFAQKSGVLSKSTEAEPPAFGPAIPIPHRLPRRENPPRIGSEDIDRAVPPVAPGVNLFAAGSARGSGAEDQRTRAERGSIYATEVLVHQEVDHSGRLGRAVTVKFEYLVSISEERDGWLGVDELRNRSHSLDSFPSHLATTGPRAWF